MFGAKPIETLEALLIEECRNLDAACRDLLVALQRFARFASTPDVRTGIEQVLRATEGNVERLERVGNVVGQPMDGRVCHAMRDIIQDIDHQIGVKMPPHVTDVAMVNGIEHVLAYRIAAYGIARKVAHRLSDQVIANCLTESMNLAAEADRDFATLADRLIEAAAHENAKSG